MRQKMIACGDILSTDVGDDDDFFSCASDQSRKARFDKALVEFKAKKEVNFQKNLKISKKKLAVSLAKVKPFKISAVDVKDVPSDSLPLKDSVDRNVHEHDVLTAPAN